MNIQVRANFHHAIPYFFTTIEANLNPFVQCEAETMNEARPAIFNLVLLDLMHLIGQVSQRMKR